MWYNLYIEERLFMSNMTKSVKEIQMELCLGVDEADMQPIIIPASPEEEHDFPRDDDIHSLIRDDE